MSKRTPQKIIVATDVRYWRRETGAQQRIFELVQFLSRQPYEVTTVFLASLDSRGESETNNDRGDRPDRSLIAAAGLSVVSLVDDWRPVGGWESVKWQGRCLLNWVKNTVKNAVKSRPGKRRPEPPLPSGHSSGHSSDRSLGRSSGQGADRLPILKRLADFESADFRLRFQAIVDRQKPDAVLVEYITLSYLVPEYSRRGSVCYLVDTHDVLSRRCEQFQHHGLSHWVELSSQEEARALQKFDVVVAIEPGEAEVFERMIELTRRESWERVPQVVVAGHPGRRQLCPQRRSDECSGLSPKVSIGILASNNGANRHALDWFFENVWPAVTAANDDVELLIAGALCDSIADPAVSAASEVSEGVNLLEHLPDRKRVVRRGRVDCVADFYSEVDMVVNPIQFGTGLKIKNVEALCYGRPLVTTTHGADSIFSQGGDPVALLPWRVADTADTMVEQILELSEDASLRQQMSAAATHFVESELGAEKTFGPLLDALENALT